MLLGVTRLPGTNLTTVMNGPVHAESPSGQRELNALVLPAGPELFRAVGAALDGDGPAVLPL